MKNFVLLLSSIFVYLTSLAVFAKTDSNLLLNLTHCSTISSGDARLACFDKLVPHRAKQPAVPVSVVALPIVDKKLSEKKHVDNFAKEHLKKNKKEQGPSSLFSTVIKVKQLLRGQWVIDLENGQRWQQKDTARIKFKVGNKVRLDKGAMGAVYLYQEDSRRNIKVKRLK